MGVVLALVVSALILCLAGLGLAVYLSRDEDNLQVDNLLSEAITQRIAEAPDYDDQLDLRDLTDFAWDRVLLVEPGTPRETISRRLGTEWTGLDTVDGGELFLFLQGSEVVRFADYRGSNPFEGFARPIAEIPYEQAVFDVNDRVIRP